MKHTIELPTEVINENKERYKVTGIMLLGKEEANIIEISPPLFMEKYDEYVDPKDIEIQRLTKQLEDLKKKYRKPRKAKRTLLPGELKEIKELIRKGEKNIAIGEEYKVSDSAVSRIRIEMRKAGEEV